VVTTVLWREHEFQRLLRGPSAPIVRDLARRATNVQNRAKLNASGRPGPRVDTGRLRSSITYAIEQDARGPVARVGTNVTYGRHLETGLRNGARYPFLEPALPAARL
jgi:Bacteriophage HK97-gp10, putative tail-component